MLEPAHRYFFWNPNSVKFENPFSAFINISSFRSPLKNSFSVHDEIAFLSHYDPVKHDSKGKLLSCEMFPEKSIPGI